MRMLLVSALLPLVGACSYAFPSEEPALAALINSLTVSATADADTTDAGDTGGSGAAGGGSGGSSAPPDTETSCENSSGKCIFVAGGVSGNFASIPMAGTIPIGRIDTYCESNKGALTGTYQAFLVDGQPGADGRIAEAGSQNNWVLQANTAYYRAADNGLIGVTNANALFDFPLTRSFDTSGQAWTGMNSAYAAAINLCDGGGVPFWDNFGAIGEVGDLTSTSNTAIFNGTAGCGGSERIICVQQ